MYIVEFPFYCVLYLECHLPEVLLYTCQHVINMYPNKVAQNAKFHFLTIQCKSFSMDLVQLSIFCSIRF